MSLDNIEIDILNLNRDSVKGSPAKHAFRTVNAILTPVRVSPLVLHPPANV